MSRSASPQSLDTPDVVLVALHGEMDVATVPHATTRHDSPPSGPKHLLLNLIDVTFFGSAAIAMLVTSYELTSHGQLHLIGVADNSVVSRVLELAGVRLLFPRHAMQPQPFATSTTRPKRPGPQLLSSTAPQPSHLRSPQPSR